MESIKGFYKALNKATENGNKARIEITPKPLSTELKSGGKVILFSGNDEYPFEAWQVDSMDENNMDSYIRMIGNFLELSECTFETEDFGIDNFVFKNIEFS